MNKNQIRLLEQCEKISWQDEAPSLDEIYIIPTKAKHESGYKIMKVVGYCDETEKCYLLDQCCDVINFGMFRSIIHNINVDIEEDGIIKVWSYHHRFKSTSRLSNCSFEVESKDVKLN